MNRTDLAVAQASRHDLTVKAADLIARTFFEAIAEALIEDDRNKIRGFGAFTVCEYRKEHEGFVFSANSSTKSGTMS